MYFLFTYLFIHLKVIESYWNIATWFLRNFSIRFEVQDPWSDRLSNGYDHPSRSSWATKMLLRNY